MVELRRSHAGEEWLERLLCGLLLAEANHHFGVAIDAAVEFLIGIGRLIDLNVMTDDLARFRAAIHDQIAQIFIVFLYGSLSAAHGDSLVKEFGNGKWENTFLC